jgi:hypothetical protein
MKVYKFSNETFGFDLHFAVFDYKNKNECDQLLALLQKSGIDRSAAKAVITNSRGFFSSGKPYYVVIDKSEFDLSKKRGVASILRTLSHECIHVQGAVLEAISEDVDRTDREAYLRISDWAFYRCLNTKFMKQFLNPVKK